MCKGCVLNGLRLGSKIGFAKRWSRSIKSAEKISNKSILFTLIMCDLSAIVYTAKSKSRWIGVIIMDGYVS